MQLVVALSQCADRLCEIARTAGRNSKALSGTGPYATRFHTAVIKLTSVELLAVPVVRTIAGFDSTLLERHLAAAKATSGTLRGRDDARKQIRLICETEVIPQLGNLCGPTEPGSEPVLPAAVFVKAPSYLQRTLLQANGCYDRKWFDASSVMIRKLVENLIIDVYERHGKETEITGGDGNYLMLSGLITSLLRQPYWPLQRESKASLPEIKRLGDRAAHNRRYEATRQDIDSVRTGLRATVDDLLHLAGHK